MCSSLMSSPQLTCRKLAREVLATKSNIFVKVRSFTSIGLSPANESLAKIYLLTFYQAGTAFFPGSSLAGNGLLVSDGETWKRQRRLSNPAFRKAAIETYSNVSNKCYELLALSLSSFLDHLEFVSLQEMTLLSKSMVNSWLKSKPSTNSKPTRNMIIRDIYSDFNNLTMMIVSRALFGGSDAMENGSEEIGSAISTAFSFFTKRATTMMISERISPPFPFNAVLSLLESPATCQSLSGCQQ